MITEKRLHELMDIAIKESEKSKPEDERIHPLVGAVLVDENGHVIAKAHRGEDGHGDHAERIAIAKAEKNGFTDFASATIFSTLEPCVRRDRNKSCSERIVRAGIQHVFIGALDPNVAIEAHGETYLREKLQVVERFPSGFYQSIRRLNRAFWALHYKDHLPSTSIYMSLRVSEMIMSKLKTANIDIDDLPEEHEYTLPDLVAYICGRSNPTMGRADLMKFLVDARASAFDRKYVDYNYENDARRVEQRWKKEFRGILEKQFHIHDFEKRRIVNVGIGNGIEGADLFDNCLDFKGVDIAPDSVKVAQSRLPKARFILNAAEKMEDIPDATADIYVSLRTFQSSFFDIHEAVHEAYRVIAPGGIFMASIANAYMDGNSLIRGLMPHNAKHVNLDRAHDLINQIRRELTKLRFDEVGVHTGKAEEYVFGRKRIG